MRKSYPSDLTPEQGELLESLLPAAKRLVGIKELLRLVALISQYQTAQPSTHEASESCQILQRPPDQGIRDNRFLEPSACVLSSTPDMAADADRHGTDGSFVVSGGKA